MMTLNGTHVEYVISKTAKRLFALRLMKRGGIIPEHRRVYELLLIYFYFSFSYQKEWVSRLPSQVAVDKKVGIYARQLVAK